MMRFFSNAFELLLNLAAMTMLLGLVIKSLNWLWITGTNAIWQ